MSPQKHQSPFSTHQIDTLQQHRVEPDPASWTRLDTMLSELREGRNPARTRPAISRLQAIAAAIAAVLLIGGAVYSLRTTEPLPPLHAENRAVEWILSAPDGASTQRINDAYQAYRSAGMIQ